ncbi:hypothetical protein TTHERM_00532630 (macronuclear) [Tetrahymena thermophila SB210]|uniref:Uncharacterized protein n=1 Tax=Tetrahymena thermophila (strain SB210) TaxID=312017 RepID=Q248A6_TETTS|nr:hypothetical protein TTHERM_00532630 [Tetrahymena thermophila SB210]EAS04139.2 hypothetical protein TTHERM_00532630 [Tetrahymena thermophila SB210]|eukprot:XP_001024384.2 hypothetical protein TTHERM_00532630 [Tetrahymena thermophila SB210]
MQKQIETLENTEHQKEFPLQLLDITTSQPIIPTDTSEKKQDSFTQIEQSFSGSNSLQGSLTHIQSNLQSDQIQSCQETQLKSESQNIQSSLSDFKLTDQLLDSNTALTQSIPFLPQKKQIKSSINKEENNKPGLQNQNIQNNTSNKSNKQNISSNYNYYHTQHKKLQGVSLQNRIFPLNNLVSSSQKLQTSNTPIASQQPMQKSEKVLRLLKKDITSCQMLDSVSTTYSAMIPTTNLDNNFDEANDDPCKMYESNQVQIDESDTLEKKIHEWLDQMDVHITCPSSKMHDYFDSIRKNTYWDIHSKILSGEDLDCFPTPGSQSSFNHLSQMTESPNPFTPTPLLERRNPGQLTTLLPACSFLNRRRHTQKLDDKKSKEIEEVYDEWDQD